MPTRLAFSLPLALIAVVTGRSAAAQPLPTLRYDPPANFYHSAIAPPDQYTSNEVQAGLQVYPFRRFTGNIVGLLRRTLLRDWIDPQFQESNLAIGPQFGRDTIPGAEAVLTARFVENVGGQPREHMRIVIVDQCDRSGEASEARATWGRLAELDPLNSRFAYQYVLALAKSGDRGGAVRHCLAHTATLKAELGSAPPTRLNELLERLQRGTFVSTQREEPPKRT